MPPPGTRGRRSRGRPPSKRDRPPASSSRPDTEADSQQQSSNRTSPSRETRTRPEDKQRGPRRKGRPPSRVGRRGRVTKQGLRSAEETAEGDRNEVEGIQESSPGNESPMHRSPSSPAAKLSRVGSSSKRSVMSPEQAEMKHSMEMDVESVYEKTEESQSAAEMRSFPVSNATGTSKKGSDEASHVDSPAGSVQMSNYPFEVFKDEEGVLRAKHATFVLPVCVGSVAFWLGKKAPEKKCYKWLVYVRSPAGVDLSHVIRRVKFQLHQSFPQPERFVNEPPYELEEIGWGEFDIGVSIEFHEDAAGPPVEMTHSLKLYTTSEASMRKPVVSENYDEIVFSEPTAAFFQRVKNEEDMRAPLSRCDGFFPRYDSNTVDECMHRINLVRSKIRNEVRALLAKAEAKGIQIDLPEAARLIEQSTIKETQQAAVVDQNSTREASLPAEDGKMRIVIDGDNQEEPLRVEVEQTKPRPLFRSDPGALNNEPAPLSPSLDFGPEFQNMQQQEVLDSEGDVIMDLDAPVDESRDEDRVDPIFIGRDCFGMEGSGSKASSDNAPLAYDEVSSSGECPDQSKQPVGLQQVFNQEPYVVSNVGSKTSENRNLSEDKAESLKGSRSSLGGASGTQPIPFESPTDAEDDL